MEITSRTASPIITVILARLLTPADFGVIATGMIIISFGQMVWDAGLSKALIQTREAPEETANVVFWINLALGLAVYLIIFIMAPWVSIFFHSQGATPVLRVLGLLVVIASLSSVQQALFVRDLDFRRLFWVKLFAAFVPGIFSIPMAYSGYGVWALVAGTLAAQTLNLVLLWHFSPWRPNFQYNNLLARKIFPFGVWVLAESIGGWLLVWGDNIAVGRFLGVRDLGIYQTGWAMVTVIFGMALNPLLSVLYPAFSRLQHDLPAMKEHFYKANRIVMALAIPIGTGLLLVGPEISKVLFGERWQGLGFVLSMLGITFCFSWLVGINTELYRAIGRPDLNTKLIFVSILYYIPAYYLAAKYNLTIFVCTRFFLVLITIPLHIFLCRKVLKVSVFYLWNDGKNFILSSLFMGVIIVSVKWGINVVGLDLPPLAILTALLAIGAGVYSAMLMLLDYSFVVHTTQLIRRAAVG